MIRRFWWRLKATLAAIIRRLLGRKTPAVTWHMQVGVGLIGLDQAGATTVTIATFPKELAIHLSDYLHGEIERDQTVCQQYVCVSPARR